MSKSAKLRMILLEEQEIRALAVAAAKLRELATADPEGDVTDEMWETMKAVCNLAITALRGAEDPAVSLALINVPELRRAGEGEARE